MADKTGNDNQPSTYRELTGDLKNGKLINLRPTDRGKVSIYPHEAERLNAKSNRTRRYYEPKEEEQLAGIENKSLNEMNDSDIQRLKAPEAQNLAKQNGADDADNMTGKDAKEFLINLKNNKQ